MFPNLYGITISLAVLAAFSLTAYRARRRGLPTDFIWDSLPWVIGFGILGARLYHVFNYLSFYIDHLVLVPQIWRGGLGIYGALIGGSLGFLVFIRFKAGTFRKFSIFNYLDAAAPGIVLGQAIGRVGNVFNGENIPYAYWEMVIDLLIFLLLVCIERAQDAKVKRQNHNSKFKNGFGLFILYLLIYSAGRFILEFFRTDSPWIAGPLTVAQWVSLGLGISVLIFRLRIHSFRHKHL